MTAVLRFAERSIAPEAFDEAAREESGKIFKRRLRAPYWEKAGRKI